MSFFHKYKLHINVILLLFWLYIIYDSVTSDDFKLVKIALPILFILLCVFNISNAIKEKKLKSRN